MSQDLGLRRCPCYASTCGLALHMPLVFTLLLPILPVEGSTDPVIQLSNAEDIITQEETQVPRTNSGRGEELRALRAQVSTAYILRTTQHSHSAGTTRCMTEGACRAPEQ